METKHVSANDGAAGCEVARGGRAEYLIPEARLIRAETIETVRSAQLPLVRGQSHRGEILPVELAGDRSFVQERA